MPEHKRRRKNTAPGITTANTDEAIGQISENLRMLWSSVNGLKNTDEETLRQSIIDEVLTRIPQQQIVQQVEEDLGAELPLFKWVKYRGYSWYADELDCINFAPYTDTDGEEILVLKPLFLQTTPWDGYSYAHRNGTHSFDHSSYSPYISRIIYDGSIGSSDYEGQVISPPYYTNEMLLTVRIPAPVNYSEAIYMDMNIAGRSWGVQYTVVDDA